MDENSNTLGNEGVSDSQNKTENIDIENPPKTDEHLYSEHNENADAVPAQNNAWHHSPPIPPNNEIRYNSQYHPIPQQNNNQYYPPFGQPFTPQKPSGDSGFAIASLVLGILSVITIFFKYVFGIASAILALIFGIISLAKNSSGKGMSVAGVVLGSVVLIFFYVVILILAYALLIFDI